MIISGKGYLSLLLSQKFPKSAVHQVDIDSRINLEHLQLVPNIQFHPVNILSPQMPQWLQSRCEGSSHSFAVVHID